MKIRESYLVFTEIKFSLYARVLKTSYSFCTKDKFLVVQEALEYTPVSATLCPEVQAATTNNHKRKEEGPLDIDHQRIIIARKLREITLIGLQKKIPIAHSHPYHFL